MKRHNTTLILVFFLLIACHKNEIDKRIVLKIGKLEVTRYEFERNKKRELTGSSSDTSSKRDPGRLAEWGKKYIEKCLVIADAYAKGYDTLSSIQKQVKDVGDAMMVQKYGYLWTKTVAPQVDACKKLNETKINKRKKLFYFDYISCDDINTLRKITNNDTVLKNKDEFLKLKDKCSLDKSLKSGYFSGQWPFLSFWKYKDILLNMQEGEVSKLLISENKYLYLFLDHVENVELTQNEKNNLQTELQIGMAQEIDEQKIHEMEIRGNPVLNDANIDTIGMFLSKGNTIFQFKKDLELIQYTLNDTIRKIRFKTFIDYYSSLIMRGDIRNKENLIDNIEQYYCNDYLTNEARRLNLYNSDIFKLDQKNFKNNVMYSEYLQDEIIRNIKIDSSKVIEYYKSNQSSFEYPKTIVVSLYAFDSKEAANRNRYPISEMLKRNELSKTKDTSIIVGLRKYISSLAIDMEAGKDYPQEFFNSLQQSDLNSLSLRPVLFNDKYVLIYKVQEQGKFIKKLESVKGIIENELVDKRLEAQLKALVEKLKSEYKIEINKTGIDN
jgi:hypothetical protein